MLFGFAHGPSRKVVPASSKSAEIRANATITERLRESFPRPFLFFTHVAQVGGRYLVAMRNRQRAVKLTLTDTARSLYSRPTLPWYVGLSKRACISFHQARRTRGRAHVTSPHFESLGLEQDARLRVTSDTSKTLPLGLRAACERDRVVAIRGR